MAIYIINFIVNMVLGLLLVPRTHTVVDSNYKKFILSYGKVIYLTITAVQLGLLCGFRDTSVGYDTGAYETIFNNAPNTILNIFEKKQNIEIGFSMLCTLIKVFGGSYQVLLVVTSLFVIGSCCVFIYRHSDDVLLSVFTIICFPFFYSSFDIIRHFIALAFLLLGYKYVVKRRFVRFFIFILIGSLFHSIAWLFLPLYFIPKIKFKISTVSVAVSLVVAAFIWMDNIVAFVGKFIGKDYSNSDWFNSYGGGTRTMIMYLVIVVIAMIMFYHLKKKDVKAHTSMWTVTILFLFSVLFINARMMTRFIMSSIPFLAIAMPALLDKFNTKVPQMRRVCYVGYLMIGVAYHAFMLLVNWQNVVPYVPFWA